MFPSETYKELCIKHQKELREECKAPQVGDWFLHWGGDKWAALCWTGEYALCLDDVIPLFQPRQIIEMLEEGVYPIWLGGPFEDLLKLSDAKFWKVIAGGEWFGPDPATALLKCLLEVMGKEQPNDQEV